MVALYCVLPAKVVAGTNAAVLPVMTTVPLTAAPPTTFASLKLPVVIVEFVIV